MTAEASGCLLTRGSPSFYLFPHLYLHAADRNQVPSSLLYSKPSVIRPQLSFLTTFSFAQCLLFLSQAEHTPHKDFFLSFVEIQFTYIKCIHLKCTVQCVLVHSFHLSLPTLCLWVCFSPLGYKPAGQTSCSPLDPQHPQQWLPGREQTPRKYMSPS